MVEGHSHGAKVAARIQVRSHTWISDSASAPGEDAGPTPHELLEAALTACTIVTLRMYVARKGYAVDDIAVTSKVESESGEASQIRREIRITGKLTDDERKSMLVIAGKCPVHKLLSSQITIETIAT